MNYVSIFVGGCYTQITARPDRFDPGQIETDLAGGKTFSSFGAAEIVRD